MTPRVPEKRGGFRWRPGLDLVNIGLLLLGAIVLKGLWEDGTLESWLPSEWRSGLRWTFAGFLAVLFILDVVGGFADLVEGLRRGGKRGAGE